MRTAGSAGAAHPRGTATCRARPPPATPAPPFTRTPLRMQTLRRLRGRSVRVGSQPRDGPSRTGRLHAPSPSSQGRGLSCAAMTPTGPARSRRPRQVDDRGAGAQLLGPPACRSPEPLGRRRGQARAPCPPLPSRLASPPLARPRDPERLWPRPVALGVRRGHPRRHSPAGFRGLRRLTCRESPDTAGEAIFSPAAGGQTRAGREVRGRTRASA